MKERPGLGITGNSSKKSSVASLRFANAPSMDSPWLIVPISGHSATKRSSSLWIMAVNVCIYLLNTRALHLNKDRTRDPLAECLSCPPALAGGPALAGTGSHVRARLLGKYRPGCWIVTMEERINGKGMDLNCESQLNGIIIVIELGDAYERKLQAVI